MKKHLIAFAIKYVIISSVTLTVLSYFDVSTTWILFTTLLLIIPAYFIGDLLIFRRFGHLTAAIIDFGYYIISIWAILFFFVDGTTISILNAAFAMMFITFAEPLYHEFVISRMMNGKQTITPRWQQTQFGTEFAKEDDIKSWLNKKKK